MDHELGLTWDDLEVLEALRLYPDRGVPGRLEIASGLIGRDVSASLARLYIAELVQRKALQPWRGTRFETEHAYSVNAKGYKLLSAIVVCRQHIGHLLSGKEELVTARAEV